MLLNILQPIKSCATESETSTPQFKKSWPLQSALHPRKRAVAKHFGSIKSKQNRKNVTQLAMNRFPVWDKIHCYLISGNVLLAHTKLLAAGLLTHLNGQTPALSGKLSVRKPIKEQEDIFYELYFSLFKKEHLNSSIFSLLKWNICEIAVQFPKSFSVHLYFFLLVYFLLCKQVSMSLS